MCVLDRRAAQVALVFRGAGLVTLGGRQVLLGLGGVARRFVVGRQGPMVALRRLVRGVRNGVLRFRVLAALGVGAVGALAGLLGRGAGPFPGGEAAGLVVVGIEAGFLFDGRIAGVSGFADRFRHGGALIFGPLVGADRRGADFAQRHFVCTKSDRPAGAVKERPLTACVLPALISIVSMGWTPHDTSVMCLSRILLQTASLLASMNSRPASSSPCTPISRTLPSTLSTESRVWVSQSGTCGGELHRVNEIDLQERLPRS